MCKSQAHASPKTVKIIGVNHTQHQNIIRPRKGSSAKNQSHPGMSESPGRTVPQWRLDLAGRSLLAASTNQAPVVYCPVPGIAGTSGGDPTLGSQQAAWKGRPR